MAHPPHPLATLAQILSTPSSQDGIPSEVEDDLRVSGCMMIQEAGVMLGLPQSTMATAQVLLHRFFYVSSMLSFGVNDISISCLYLSSKLNETPLRLRDLINTYIFLSARVQHLLKLPADKPLPFEGEGQAGPSNVGMRSVAPMNGKGKGKIWEGFDFEVPAFHAEVFWEWKDIIVVSEVQILKRLGFNMQVDLPYNHVINYCKILDLVFEDDVVQTCWSILNDALLTPLYAQHPPHTLACSSILLTTRLKRIPLPKDWWLLFDVDYEDLWICCGRVMVLWDDWGSGVLPPAEGPRDTLGWMGDPGLGTELDGRQSQTEQIMKKENRWRRAWILSQGRRSVRKWMEERKESNMDAVSEAI